MSSQRMYPIQDGPSVPYEVMVPYEAQCQRNHGQSIDRIADRGGFGCCEAWCVVNGLHWYDVQQDIGLPEAKRRWIEYAERINLHYAELEELRKYIDEQARVADANSKEWLAAGAGGQENAAYRAGIWYAYNDIRNRLPKIP